MNKQLRTVLSLALTVGVAAVSCTLITEPDRSKIGDAGGEAGSSQGGSDAGTGGANTGGAPLGGSGNDGGAGGQGGHGGA